MRPEELAQDDSPEWLAWRHAIRWFQAERGAFDIFLSLPATSPFRAVADIEACLATLRDDPATDIVITVRNADGCNALWLACYNGDHGIIRRLLDAGIDLDLQNGNGATCLMYVASNSKPNLVKLHCL